MTIKNAEYIAEIYAANYELAENMNVKKKHVDGIAVCLTVFDIINNINKDDLDMLCNSINRKMKKLDEIISQNQ